MSQTMMAVSHTVTMTGKAQSSTDSRQPAGRNIKADILSLAIPLFVLAALGARILQTGTLYYTTNHADPTYGYGDLYRYVSMALPNGNVGWAHEAPFVYRPLVPWIVRGFYLLGIPFQWTFFSITSIALVASTIIIFFLVRGAGVSRMEASCAALAYVTLYWTVIYEFHDYFLIDAAAQAFVVAILLAVQREKFVLAAALAGVGVVCNERTYLAVAVGVVQILMPHLRPLAQTLGDIARLRVVGVVRRIPQATWTRLALLIVLPLAATFFVHMVQHATYPPGYTPPSGIIATTIDTWKAYIPMHFKSGSKIHALYTLMVVATFFTFGVLFVTALAALPLRAYSRTRFSFWSLLAALLIIAYSYTSSGDNQRLSILGWPFVIMCAAVTLNELSRRLRASMALLWAIVLIGESIFQPALYGKDPVIIPAQVRPLIENIYIPTMLVCSGIIAVLVFVAMMRSAPAAAALAGAGGSLTETPHDSVDDEHDETMKSLIARPTAMQPLPDDSDSVFWMNYRGGVAALADRCVWLAGERLHLLITAHLVPMTARAQGWNAADLHDPRWRETLARWQPVSSDIGSLWQAYQLVPADYQTLAQRLGVPPSPRDDLRRDALAALDVGLRQQQNAAADPLTWQTISIVLPAYNEEVVIAQTIHDCLRAAQRVCPNAEVIIVDDGSRDRTGAIIDEWASRDARVVAVHNRPNQGYGGALLAGFAAARGEWLFFMDSDGQFDINQIAELLARGIARPQAAILGYRAHRRDPFLRRLNAWGWKRIVGMVLGLRGVRDIDCAFKLLPAQTVKACNVQAQGAMVNTEMLVKMQRIGVPFEQVPVQHFPRKHGTATGANLRVILRAFRELLRLRLRLHEWHPPKLDATGT